MKHIHASFRASVSQAMKLLGVEWRFFLEQCDYYQLLDEIDRFDDAQTIAVHALLNLCDGSSRTIDKAVMVAVVEYLDTVLHPNPRQSTETRLRALLKLYPSDAHGYADWASIWYG